MGILTETLAHRPGERRSTYGAGDDFWYTHPAYLEKTHAGVEVDDSVAWTSTSIWACIHILAESIGSLPAFTYVRMTGGGKAHAWRHASYRALHDEANPVMGALQWKETAVAHVCTAGNHYSEIVRRQDGSIELWPWNPRQVVPSWGWNPRLAWLGEFLAANNLPSDDLYYILTDSTGQRHVFSARDVLHIAGLAWNGLVGLSPIEYARQTIALSLAEEEYAARFYGDGANPGLVVEAPPGIHKDAAESRRAREDLEVQYGGLSRSHRIMMLQDGLKATSHVITPEQAQFLDGRKFTKAQIASIYRVPLHLIQEHEKSTAWGTGIEQFNSQFVMHTLRPWLVRMEQAFNRRLLAPEERGMYFTRFALEGLLRGDSVARAAWYKTLRELGAITANEIRELEDMNPRTDDGGDTYWDPASNFRPAATPEPMPSRSVVVPELPVPVALPAGVDVRAVLLAAQTNAVADVIRRALRRERQDVPAALSKGGPGAIGAVYDREAERLAGELAVPVRAVATALRELSGEELDLEPLARWVLNWCAERRGKVDALVAESNGSAAAAVTEFFAENSAADLYAARALREATCCLT